METKLCVVCGKEFSKKQTCSKKEWEQRKFCSNKCVNVRRVPCNKGKKTGQVPWNKGLKDCYSEETRQKMGADKIGKPTSDLQKQKVSEANSGPNSHLWKGGITPLNQAIRTSTKYSEWRLSIFERDGFQCQSCKKIGGYLEAHHIKFFSSIIEKNNITTFEAAMLCQELWDIDNGITLCSECHEKLPKK